MTAFSCGNFASCPNLKTRSESMQRFSENGGRKNSVNPCPVMRSYDDFVSGQARILVHPLLIFSLNAGLTAISLSVTGKPYTRRVPLR